MEHSPNSPESNSERITDEEALASLSRDGYENNEVYLAWVRALEETADVEQLGEEGRFGVNEKIAAILKKAGYIEEAYVTMCSLYEMANQMKNPEKMERVLKLIEELMD